MSSNTYSPSGKIGPKSLLVIPAALIGALALGWVYTMILFVNPIIYLSLVIFAGFCYGLGWASKMMIIHGHVRNISLSILIGLILGLGITYFSHAELYAQLTELSIAEFALNPLYMWESAKFIAEQGYFEVKNSSVNGDMLWGLWTIEAIGLIAVPIYMSYSHATSRVYCENCNQWAEEDNNLMLFAVEDSEATKQQFLSGNFDFLKTAMPLTHADVQSEGEHLSIDEEWCRSCENTYALSLRKNKRKHGKEQIEIDTSTLVEDLLIDKDMHLFMQDENNAPQVSVPDNMKVDQILITLLGQMAKADGHVDDKEIETISEVCSKVTGEEITIDNVKASIEAIDDQNFNVNDYARQASGYLSDDGKALVVQTAIMVAWADGEADESETTMLQEIASSLGISAEAFNHIIESMSKDE